MPIYEYQCLQCGKEFEVFRGVRDTTTPSCRFCNGQVKKLISVSSFHLKGSGWYVTDYARKGAGANGSAGKMEEKTETPAKTEKTETAASSNSSTD